MSLFKQDGNNLSLEAGYWLEVVSWENDGDHYRTKYQLFATAEEATSYINMVSKYASVYGNSGDWSNEDSLWNKYTALLSEEDKAEIQSAIRKRYEPQYNISDAFDSSSDNYEDARDTITDWMSEAAWEIMGGSESYDCRVMESWKIFEVPTSITVKTVAHSNGRCARVR